MACGLYIPYSKILECPVCSMEVPEHAIALHVSMHPACPGCQSKFISDFALAIHRATACSSVKRPGNRRPKVVAFGLGAPTSEQRRRSAEAAPTHRRGAAVPRTLSTVGNGHRGQRRGRPRNKPAEISEAERPPFDAASGEDHTTAPSCAPAASGVEVASERTEDDAEKPDDDAEKPEDDAEKPDDDAEKPEDDAENPEDASFGSLLSDDDDDDEDEEEDGRKHEGGTTTTTPTSSASAVIDAASESPTSDGNDDDGHRGRPCGRPSRNKTRRTQSERDRRGELIRLFTHLRRTMYGGRPPWEGDPRSKMSQISLLKIAEKYIEELHFEERKLIDVKGCEAEKNEELRDQVARLWLQQHGPVRSPPPPTTTTALWESAAKGVDYGSWIIDASPPSKRRPGPGSDLDVVTTGRDLDVDSPRGKAGQRPEGDRGDGPAADYDDGNDGDGKPVTASVDATNCEEENRSDDDGGGMTNPTTGPTSEETESPATETAGIDGGNDGDTDGGLLGTKNYDDEDGDNDGGGDDDDGGGDDGVDGEVDDAYLEGLNDAELSSDDLEAALCLEGWEG